MDGARLLCLLPGPRLILLSLALSEFLRMDLGIRAAPPAAWELGSWPTLSFVLEFIFCYCQVMLGLLIDLTNVAVLQHNLPVCLNVNPILFNAYYCSSSVLVGIRDGYYPISDLDVGSAAPSLVTAAGAATGNFYL